jgi:DNA-binding transcriptional LysR family regulator
MNIRLPSLQALQVFEISARLLSFTKAAAELNVTQVAVSRMILRLEDALGFKLFVRTKSGLSLTEQGVILQRSVASGFAEIGNTISELKRSSAQDGIVTLSLSSGFAALWLLPRLGQFKRQFPTINLRLQVMISRLYGPLEDADVGIRLHGAGSQNDPNCFVPEIILPICNPGYLAQFGSLDSTANSGEHTFIHLDQTTLTWSDFFRTTGLGAGPSGKSIHPSDNNLSLQCAMLGEGIALAWLLAITGSLKSGQVVPACGSYISTGSNYVIEYRSSQPSEKVEMVGQWLIQEMRKDLVDVQEIMLGMKDIRRT